LVAHRGGGRRGRRLRWAILGPATELADAIAQRLAELWQFAGAKDDQYERQDKYEMGGL
jgi:hypothetical protein